MCGPVVGDLPGMIITNLIGGLGNQMFQYAAGRSLSYSLDASLFLDTRMYREVGSHNGFELDRVFNIRAVIASQRELKQCLGWRASKIGNYVIRKNYLKFLRNEGICVEEKGMDMDSIYSRNPCYLFGYWQSEKYFINNENVIRKDLTFINELKGMNADIRDHIDSVESVGVHIRRGDYVTNKHASALHGVCPQGYYDKAMQYIYRKVSSPTFFVFSDEPEWVKKNMKFRFPVNYIASNHGEDSYVDMQLMSLCKHNIISNSTFSWWAAWLNKNIEKIIVSPQTWFIGIAANSDGLIPDSWIRV